MPRRSKAARHLDRIRPRGRKIRSETEITIDRNIVSEDARVLGPSESSVDSTIVTKSENATVIPIITTRILAESESATITVTPIITESVNAAVTSGSPMSTGVISGIGYTSENTSNIEKKRAQLIDRIGALPSDEVHAACYLFETMTYADGKRKGKILSPYLINKANGFLIAGLHKKHSSSQAIQNKIKSLQRENRKLQKKIVKSRVKVVRRGDDKTR